MRSSEWRTCLSSQVRRRYLLLLSLRWLAVGLVIPVQVLLPLARD